MLQAARSANQYRVKAASVPAPVGGLNSRDSIDAMPPTDALIMSNFFPTTGKITLRDGYTQFCTGIGTGDVETLIEHSAGSNRQLLAIGSNGTYYTRLTPGQRLVEKLALPMAVQSISSLIIILLWCRLAQTYRLAGMAQARLICQSHYPTA
jgi:hypothetical protein